MNVKRTIGVFLSGFVVYGLVASTVRAGGGRVHLDQPVPSANADSGSRLKAEYLAGDDGSKDYQLTLAPWSPPPNDNYAAVRPINVYWDAMRGEECMFQLAGDGKWRCLPTDVALGHPTFYTDAACTKGMVQLLASSPGCPPSVPKYAASVDAGQVCPITAGFPPVHYYQIGNFLGQNPQCYQQTNNACMPVACGNSPQAIFYAIGPEIDPTSFVAATPMKDP